ncbi:MAG: outer membrane protein, partial [Flavobacteriales bacterium]
MKPTRHLLSVLFSLILLSQPAIVFGASNDDSSDSPSISITPTYGYFFAETFQTEYGKVRLNESAIYGVSLGLRKSSWSEFEVNWTHQLTRADANIYYFDGHNSIIQENASGDVAIDYFTVGMNGVKEFNDRISGYVGLGAGLVVFTPQNRNIEAQARFALTLKAGVRAAITDFLAIRIQPQLFSPLQSVGANVFI